MGMKVWVITVNWEETIFLPPQFEPEVYTKENSARTRINNLNNCKPEHCGYWFMLDSVTLDKKNRDW